MKWSNLNPLECPISLFLEALDQGTPHLTKVHLHGTLLLRSERAGYLCQVGVGRLDKRLHSSDNVLSNLALQSLGFEGLDDENEGLRWVADNGWVLPTIHS